jgi:hypothetical protein
MWNSDRAMYVRALRVFRVRPLWNAYTKPGANAYTKPGAWVVWHNWIKSGK